MLVEYEPRVEAIGIQVQHLNIVYIRVVPQPLKRLLQKSVAEAVVIRMGIDD
jgi:hypothetical protein